MPRHDAGALRRRDCRRFRIYRRQLMMPLTLRRDAFYAACSSTLPGEKIAAEAPLPRLMMPPAATRCRVELQIRRHTLSFAPVLSR